MKIHFAESIRGAPGQTQTWHLHPPRVPLAIFSLPFSCIFASFLPSLVHTFIPHTHTHHPLPPFSPLSPSLVEVPLGEFGSRQILRNEKKLLTQWGKNSFGRHKDRVYPEMLATQQHPHTHAHAFISFFKTDLFSSACARFVTGGEKSGQDHSFPDWWLHSFY